MCDLDFNHLATSTHWRPMVGFIIGSLVALLLCPIILWDSACLWGRFHDAWVLFVPWLAWCIMPWVLHGTSFLICSILFCIGGKISTITSLCIRSQQPADIVYKIPSCPVVSIAFLGQISIQPSCQRGKTSRHVLPEWIAFKSTLLMYANTTKKAGYIPTFLFPDTRSGVAWKPWKWKLLGHIVILNRHSIVITLPTSLNTHHVNEVRTLSDGRHPEHGKTGFTKKHAVDGRQHLGSCFLC